MIQSLEKVRRHLSYHAQRYPFDDSKSGEGET